MAAWGASDSVITQTPVSLNSCRSLFFFSLFLSTGGFAQQTHAFILSTISYNLLYTLSSEDCSGVDTGRPSIMKMERNGRREAHKNLSFHFTWWSAGERGPFISLSHALIYISTNISLSIHPAVLLSKMKRQFCNIYTCGGLIAIVLFPFSALYGVCQTQWT